ncbi:MOSC domain-containing protein [Halalkalibacter kiskunsagensis]|uniref:MOSC domain-containing protein n=1 Tax=Halalkalibacter kiskunsagensis TaxID=1548599 RepID=A0ABV6KE42_9BACI
MTIGTIISLNIGQTKNISDEDEKQIDSAIYKHSVSDTSLYLSTTNLEGDEQADLVNHGGSDKAVCVYPFEHYSYWENKFGFDLPIGAFGENITLRGVPESKVFIGDTWQWGEAIVQVSQPRRPCFKVAKRHGIKKLPLYIQETGFSGYYLRVVKEGNVSGKDPFSLLNRMSDVSIEHVNRITFYDKENYEEIKKLLNLKELSEAWKASLK